MRRGIGGENIVVELVYTSLIIFFMPIIIFIIVFFVSNDYTLSIYPEFNLFEFFGAILVAGIVTLAFTLGFLIAISYLKMIGVVIKGWINYFKDRKLSKQIAKECYRQYTSEHGYVYLIYLGYLIYALMWFIPGFVMVWQLQTWF